MRRLMNCLRGFQSHVVCSCEPVLDPTVCGGPSAPLWVDDAIVLSDIIRKRRERAKEASHGT